MLEKKVMWVLEKTKMEPEKRLVIFEDGIPFRESKWNERENAFGDYLGIPLSESRYFETRELAIAWLSANKPSREEIDRIMLWLRRDEKTFEESYDKIFGKDKWKAPVFIRQRFEEDDPKDGIPGCDMTKAINQYIQEGILNIDGCSFNKKNVLRIEWGPGNDQDQMWYEKDCPIRIILKGDHVIYPRNPHERWFIYLAFGINYVSETCYNKIEIPKITKDKQTP